MRVGWWVGICREAEEAFLVMGVEEGGGIHGGIKEAANWFFFFVAI